MGISTLSIFANAFMPHGMCYLWKPELVGLHLVSDTIIAISYFSIPFTLVHIVRKREDLPFDWIFFLFAAFIIFCGSGHLMDIWTLWHPNYWLSGSIGAMTAIVSMLTAIALVRLVPQIMSLPSPAQIEQTNQQLRAEIRDRKQIEAQLQQEQYFLKTMLNNLSDGIVACDKTGNLTLFNKTSERFHGLPQAAISAKEWSQYYDLYLADGKTPMSKEQIPLFRALAGESVRDVEMAIVPKNEKPRFILASGDPIITTAGECLGAVVAMRDISDRLQAQRALQESEQRFRAIFNSMFQFIGLMQPDGTLLEANQTALDFAGIKSEEVIGRPFWETSWWREKAEGRGQMAEGKEKAEGRWQRAQGKEKEERQKFDHSLGSSHPNHTSPSPHLPISASPRPPLPSLSPKQQRLKEAIASAAKGQFVRYEVDVIGAGDRIAIIDFSIKPVFDEQGKVVLLIPEGREITERKRAEEALKKSEERWQLALLGAGDGIFDWNIATGEVFMSARLKETLGYSDSEIPNNFQGWENLVHQDDLQEVLRTVQGHLEQETPQYSAEYRMRCKDGSYKWILARGQAQWNREQQAVRMVGSHQDISDRKGAEEALRESEQRFFEAFEYAAIGMALVSPEGRWLRVNKALCELVGYSEKELLATTFQAITHPEDLEVDLNYVRQLLAGDIYTYQLEKRYYHKQGHEVWILLSVALVRNAQGQPLYFIAQIQDINARRAAEAEILRLNQELEARVARRTEQLETANYLKDKLLIREREAKAKIQLYQDVVENIPIGVCIWRLDNLEEIGSFRLVELNPAAGQLLQISREEDLGKTIVECFPNALNEPYQDAVKTYAKVVRNYRAQELGEVIYGDERRSQQIFGVKAFPLPDRCVGVAFENITERKHIERALVKSTHRYRTVVNSIKEVIFQTDLEGHWTLLNSAWADITGYSVIESLKRSFSDFIFAPEERQHCLKLFQALVAGEQKSFRYEFRTQTKSGEFRWLEINAQLNREDEDSEITGTSGAINDTTERKQAEAMLQARAEELSQLNTMLLKTASELEKRNKELEQFAYVTSHDLKAPLRAIANLSEWIEEDLEDCLTPDTKNQMSLLRGRVRRMENLINALLQYSRVGRIKSQPEPVDVTLLLNEIIDSLAPPEGFRIAIDGKMPTLMTERLPLMQVFSNLISNAIKHHHSSKGKIDISVEDKGKFYEFSVSDDGTGIAPEYHDKVFIIFQTLEARDNKESTGIGLSIVKKIIETQGGTIQLDSQLGRGSTFRFTWKK